MNLDYLSASTIDSFLTCPRKMYLSKTAQTPDRVEQAATALGSAVHEALEKWYETYLTAPRSLVDIFDEVSKDYMILDKTRFTDARSFLGEYERTNTPDNTTIALEKRFEVELGGFKLHGIIDRIDYLGNGVYKIVDYKTSFVMKSDAELAEDLQLSIYDIALRKMYENGEFPDLEEPKEVLSSLNYIRYQTEVPVTFTDKQRQDTEDFISYIGFKIAMTTEEPDPKLNQYCCYCDYRGDCPLYSSDFANYLDVEYAGSLDELAAQLIDLRNIRKMVSTRIDNLQAQIITDLDQRGDNYYSSMNGEVRIATNSRTRYDLGAIKRALGDRWTDYAVVDPNAISTSGTTDDQSLLQAHAVTFQTQPFIRAYKAKRS
jgi:RecB family exonuclease